MAIYVVPPEMRKNIGGHAGFTDSGRSGMGIPAYTRRPGYQGFSVPTPIGARWFPPEPDYDDDDNAVPMATGNTMQGGRPVYQEKVYQQAKKVGRAHGLSRKQIDELKPKVVA